MVQARLIARLLLLAAALLSRETSFHSPGEAEPEPSEWERFNERCASDSIKTLTTAEADFRACDGDWNHVNDFWTADVQGLYTMTSAAPKEEPERHGCGVNDFWSGEVKGFYRFNGETWIASDEETRP